MGHPNQRYGVLVQAAIPMGGYDPKEFPLRHGWRPVIFEYDARGIGATTHRGVVYPRPDLAWDALSKECKKRGIADIRDGGHMEPKPEMEE